MFKLLLIAKSKSHSSLPPQVNTASDNIPQLPCLQHNSCSGFIKIQRNADKNETINDKDCEDVKNEHLLETTISNNSEKNSEAKIKVPSGLPQLHGGLRRCQTQVMGPDQHARDITRTTGSIADRLAALQKSGEDDWKRRISKREEIDSICPENLVNESVSLSHSLSEKQPTQPLLISHSVEGGNVSERLGKLQSSSQKWKNRVEKSDADKFTVASRLQNKVQSLPELQFKRSEKGSEKKCTMLTVYSSSKTRLQLEGSPSKEIVNYDLEFSVNNNKDGSNDRMEFNNNNLNKHASVKNEINGNNNVVTSSFNGSTCVVVPQLDDEETFMNFFPLQKSVIETSIDKVNISDFDEIKCTKRLVGRRAIQGPKGRRAASRNALKNLNMRNDIRLEYTEIKTDIAEREMHRIKLESSNQRNNLATEAIAALAASEDFTAIALKPSSEPSNTPWLPYKPLMLLHVKGRTHIQTRLVEATYTSLNRGDCFILVAGSQLFRYVGAFANVIEISRSKKLCAHIIENKEFGCNASKETVLNDDSYLNDRLWTKFWQLLGKPEHYAIPESGHVDEDDLFETCLIETNKVYEYQANMFIPVEKYWGCIPKIEMLDSTKILIFDFGSELYVWNGKNAGLENKRAAMKLAEEYFDSVNIDYSSCYLNPLNYATIAGVRDCYMFAKVIEKRDDWCILGKITQNMETILFKEKFADWPETKRDDIEKGYFSNGMHSLMALDGAIMYHGELYHDPNVVLENANIGRGNEYYDEDTMRHFDVVTKSVDQWVINEFNFDNINCNRCGNFYSAESYIVRWIYQISVTVKELTGKMSNRATVGRDRCVYFCWQGSDASANEKGAAALLTIELDKEKGTQMCVAQGEENSAFIRLFHTFFLHRGRREDCLVRRNCWRLYHVKGNIQEETMLMEVDCRAQQLRSRGSMILINGGDEAQLYVWHGCKSASHTRFLAENAARSLMQNPPEDMFTNTDNKASIKLESVEEGNEPTIFENALGGLLPEQYGSLLRLSLSKTFDYTPRLFHFSSSTQGVFSVTEIQYVLRCKELHSPYPFTQTQLYNARQPTIFMIDDGDMLWLWMGWWPTVEETNVMDGGNTSPSNDNRACVNRWISERRAALETSVSYWRAKFGDKNDELFHGIKGYLVWAGLETHDFKALFPEWTDHDHIKDINLKDGRILQRTPIVDILTELSQTEYSLAVLKSRPLPEGVDPTRLELYLKSAEFEEALGMTREDFEAIPLWKQSSLKKEHGLF